MNYYQFDVSYEERGTVLHMPIGAYGEDEQEARKMLALPDLAGNPKLPDNVQSIVVKSEQAIDDFTKNPIWEKGRDMFQPYTASWWTMQ